VITLKGNATEGSGTGLVRIAGSFTTNSGGTPILVRPSKGNFTVTRKAAGVYVVSYQQAGLSVVMNDSWVTYSKAIVGAGSVALGTSVLGNVNVSGDFMTSDSTHYTSDATNKNVLVLVYAAASNPTSLTLTDVYGLGNTGGVANYRVAIEICISTNTYNQ